MMFQVLDPIPKRGVFAAREIEKSPESHGKDGGWRGKENRWEDERNSVRGTNVISVLLLVARKDQTVFGDIQ